MEDSNNENIYWRFIKFLTSTALTIALLDLSGVDLTKVSIFSSDTFSFAIAGLFVVCFLTFDNMLISIAKWLKRKEK
ncbi:hypothetical protein [Colwellia sp. TT2012]|uniref:hypothetical protein n=1 Tax=Colwellia sp. TT2012 TaxID=1720342 RepID=UPI000710FA2B|nr:hypothetical protein [Colwellia sp. TT2012]